MHSITIAEFTLQSATFQRSKGHGK